MPRGRGPSTARAPSTAGASLSQAAGKLVATNRSGTDKGRLPGKFVADVPKTQTFGASFEVADNAPGAPQTLGDDRRFGTLTATCNDQAQRGRATRTRSRSIAFNNTSGSASTSPAASATATAPVVAVAEPDRRRR